MGKPSVEKRFQQVLQRHFKTNDKVLAAVSGGVDSMAMLDLLLAHQQMLGYQVEVVHIHHHLRQASDDEWRFVEGYCLQRGVPFHGRHIHVLDGIKGSMEATAHRLRYEAFHEVANERGANWICLAHHANDRAETLLANLLRGTSVAGLAAMPECNGALLRPLIDVTRAEIEAYCMSHDIQYVIDESNIDTTILRNRIRHDLLPLLETYNPEVVAALNRLSSSAEQEQAFLQQEAHALAHKAMRFDANRWCLLDAAILREAPPACFATLLREKVQHFVTGRSPIHAEMISQCQRLLHEGGQYDLGAGLLFEATRRYVYIGQCPFGEWKYQDEMWQHDFLEASLQSSEQFQIRYAQPGDAIKLKNLGAKKIKKIFQEAGWPIVLRSCWPVVCYKESNEIIWVPFLARSTTLMYYYRVIEYQKNISMKLAQKREQVINSEKQEDS